MLELIQPYKAWVSAAVNVADEYHGNNILNTLIIMKDLIMFISGGFNI